MWNFNLLYRRREWQAWLAPLSSTSWPQRKKKSNHFSKPCLPGPASITQSHVEQLHENKRKKYSKYCKNFECCPVSGENNVMNSASQLSERSTISCKVFVFLFVFVFCVWQDSYQMSQRLQVSKIVFEDDIKMCLSLSLTLSLSVLGLHLDSLTI